MFEVVHYSEVESFLLIWWELTLWELISWELILWEVDLVGVDLMGIDFVGVDLVGMNQMYGSVESDSVKSARKAKVSCTRPVKERQELVSELWQSRAVYRQYCVYNQLACFDYQLNCVDYHLDCDDYHWTVLTTN